MPSISLSHNGTVRVGAAVHVSVTPCSDWASEVELPHHSLASLLR